MSVVQTRKLDDVPAELWQNLRVAPLAGPFYDLQLLQLWEMVYGWKSLLFSCGNSHLVGFVKKTVLGEMFYSLPFGWYGGVLSPEFNADEPRGFTILSWHSPTAQPALCKPLATAFPLRGTPTGTGVEWSRRI